MPRKKQSPTTQNAVPVAEAAPAAESNPNAVSPAEVRDVQPTWTERLDLPQLRAESGKPVYVVCPMSEQQRTLKQELVERYERLRTQKVDPREDNALAITNAGRELSLDARLLVGDTVDFSDSKVNALVENVVGVWQRTEAKRGTQMIFCDLGIHPTPWGFSVYNDIVAKLIDGGIPREQIAAIGDADSDAKKRSLFEKVRNGQVRVLMGSTHKMGATASIQQRLTALHHLDAPWTLAEVEQREGQLLREGNENEDVAIYRYVTEGSLDSYLWQTLENKARFIAATKAIVAAEDPVAEIGEPGRSESPAEAGTEADKSPRRSSPRGR